MYNMYNISVNIVHKIACNIDRNIQAILFTILINMLYYIVCNIKKYVLQYYT